MTVWMSPSTEGYKERKKLVETSKSVYLFVRLATDLANQPKLLPNLVDVGVVLHQQSNSFRLMFASTTEAPRVIIEDISLFYRTVKLTAALSAAIAETIRLQPARYPIPYVQVITFQITKSHTLVNRETLSRGQLPKVVVVGLVEATAFNGNGKQNPFNFQSKSANYVCLYRDSDMIPHVPFTPNFARG